MATPPAKPPVRPVAKAPPGFFVDDDNAPPTPKPEPPAPPKPEEKPVALKDAKLSINIDRATGKALLLYRHDAQLPPDIQQTADAIVASILRLEKKTGMPVDNRIVMLRSNDNVLISTSGDGVSNAQLSIGYNFLEKPGQAEKLDVIFLHEAGHEYYAPLRQRFGTSHTLYQDLQAIGKLDHKFSSAPDKMAERAAHIIKYYDGKPEDFFADLKTMAAFADKHFAAIGPGHPLRTTTDTQMAQWLHKAREHMKIDGTIGDSPLKPYLEGGALTHETIVAHARLSRCGDSKQSNITPADIEAAKPHMDAMLRELRKATEAVREHVRLGNKVIRGEEFNCDRFMAERTSHPGDAIKLLTQYHEMGKPQLPDVRDSDHPTFEQRIAEVRKLQDAGKPNAKPHVFVDIDDEPPVREAQKKSAAPPPAEPPPSDIKSAMLQIIVDRANGKAILTHKHDFVPPPGAQQAADAIVKAMLNVEKTTGLTFYNGIAMDKYGDNVAIETRNNQPRLFVGYEYLQHPDRTQTIEAVLLHEAGHQHYSPLRNLLRNTDGLTSDLGVFSKLKKAQAGDAEKTARILKVYDGNYDAFKADIEKLKSYTSQRLAAIGADHPLRTASDMQVADMLRAAHAHMQQHGNLGDSPLAAYANVDTTVPPEIADVMRRLSDCASTTRIKVDAAEIEAAKPQIEKLQQWLAEGETAVRENFHLFTKLRRGEEYNCDRYMVEHATDPMDGVRHRQAKAARRANPPESDVSGLIHPHSDDRIKAALAIAEEIAEKRRAPAEAKTATHSTISETKEKAGKAHNQIIEDAIKRGPKVDVGSNTQRGNIVNPLPKEIPPIPNGGWGGNELKKGGVNSKLGTPQAEAAGGGIGMSLGGFAIALRGALEANSTLGTLDQCFMDGKLTNYSLATISGAHLVTAATGTISKTSAVTGTAFVPVGIYAAQAHLRQGWRDAKELGFGSADSLGNFAMGGATAYVSGGAVFATKHAFKAVPIVGEVLMMEAAVDGVATYFGHAEEMQKSHDTGLQQLGKELLHYKKGVIPTLQTQIAALKSQSRQPGATYLDLQLDTKKLAGLEGLQGWVESMSRAQEKTFRGREIYYDHDRFKGQDFARFVGEPPKEPEKLKQWLHQLGEENKNLIKKQIECMKGCPNYQVGWMTSRDNLDTEETMTKILQSAGNSLNNNADDRKLLQGDMLALAQMYAFQDKIDMARELYFNVSPFQSKISQMCKNMDSMHIDKQTEFLRELNSSLHTDGIWAGGILASGRTDFYTSLFTDEREQARLAALLKKTLIKIEHEGCVTPEQKLDYAMTRSGKNNAFTAAWAKVMAKEAADNKEKLPLYESLYASSETVQQKLIAEGGLQGTLENNLEKLYDVAFGAAVSAKDKEAALGAINKVLTAHSASVISPASLPDKKIMVSELKRALLAAYPDKRENQVFELLEPFVKELHNPATGLADTNPLKSYTTLNMALDKDLARVEALFNTDLASRTDAEAQRFKAMIAPLPAGLPMEQQIDRKIKRLQQLTTVQGLSSDVVNFGASFQYKFSHGDFKSVWPELQAVDAGSLKVTGTMARYFAPEKRPEERVRNVDSTTHVAMPLPDYSEQYKKAAREYNQLVIEYCQKKEADTKTGIPTSLTDVLLRKVIGERAKLETLYKPEELAVIPIRNKLMGENNRKWLQACEAQEVENNKQLGELAKKMKEPGALTPSPEEAQSAVRLKDEYLAARAEIDVMQKALVASARIIVPPGEKERLEAKLITLKVQMLGKQQLFVQQALQGKASPNAIYHALAAEKLLSKEQLAAHDYLSETIINVRNNNGAPVTSGESLLVVQGGGKPVWQEIWTPERETLLREVVHGLHKNAQADAARIISEEARANWSTRDYTVDLAGQANDAAMAKRAQSPSMSVPLTKEYRLREIDLKVRNFTPAQYNTVSPEEAVQHFTAQFDTGEVTIRHLKFYNEGTFLVPQTDPGANPELTSEGKNFMAKVAKELCKDYGKTLKKLSADLDKALKNTDGDDEPLTTEQLKDLFKAAQSDVKYLLKKGVNVETEDTSQLEYELLEKAERLEKFRKLADRSTPVDSKKIFGANEDRIIDESEQVGSLQRLSLAQAPEGLSALTPIQSQLENGENTTQIAIDKLTTNEKPIGAMSHEMGIALAKFKEGKGETSFVNYKQKDKGKENDFSV